MPSASAAAAPLKPRQASPASPARPPEDRTVPRLIGVTIHLGRDQEVFGEGESAEQVFKVVHGAARGFRVLADGRRQICEFYLPGELFGLEPDGEHHLTAEALGETVLIAARRSALGDDRDADAARRLCKLAMAQIRRGQEHALTLGRRSAGERVAHFLLDMAERLGCGDHLDLPMSRQDIADYLGLTIETVSRTLTQMQGSGLIKISGCRSVSLCKPAALADLCA
jgi:CRP-like cAMP-binding protein